MVQLDGLRFLAVSAVAFNHWTWDLHLHLRLVDTFLGMFGVNLFFVLSGFLITQILMRDRDKVTDKGFLIRQFYTRRFLRIFPLYYAVLFGAYILAIPTARADFFWFFSYTSNIKNGISHFNTGFLSHLWTLSVEEQFYIIFPFIVLYTPVKYYLKVFITLIIIGIISRFICYIYFPKTILTYTFTSCCFDCFGFGAIMAYLKIYNPQLLKNLLKKRLHFTVALVLLIANYVLIYFTHESLINSLSIRFFCAIVCFGIIGNASLRNYRGAFGKFLENKKIIYLGKISYGLYVYHHFMPWIFSHSFLNTKYQVFIYPFLTIAISAVSWHYFEKPLNNLKDKFAYYKKRTLPAL